MDGNTNASVTPTPIFVILLMYDRKSSFLRPFPSYAGYGLMMTHWLDDLGPPLPSNWPRDFSWRRNFFVALIVESTRADSHQQPVAYMPEICQSTRSAIDNPCPSPRVTSDKTSQFSGIVPNLRTMSQRPGYFLSENCFVPALKNAR